MTCKKVAPMGIDNLKPSLRSAGFRHKITVYMYSIVFVSVML